MVTISAPSRTINEVPTVELEEHEAPRLPLPVIDVSSDSLDVFIPPGNASTLPDTVIVYLEPRVEPSIAFDLLEAVVDSNSVRLLGATMDCSFVAPEKGETLTIVTDSTGCRGYISGVPVIQTVTVLLDQIQQDKGFFSQIGDMIKQIIFVIAALFVVSIAIPIIKSIRKK